MKLKILKNRYEENLRKPAKIGDVGYDLVAAEMKIVGVKTEASQEKNDLDSYWHEIHYIEYDTKIALEPAYYGVSPEEGEDGLLCFPERLFTDLTKYPEIRPRSSNCNYNLVLANTPATIDPNFRGTIKCRFKYIFSPADLKVLMNGQIVGKINPARIYKVGERVAQAVFSDVIHPTEIIYVDKLSDSERKSGGFGSTGNL